MCRKGLPTTHSRPYVYDIDQIHTNPRVTINVGNESLYIALGGLLLGLLAWSFSKIFDRTQADLAAMQVQLAELRSECLKKTQEFEYRLRALEEA